MTPAVWRRLTPAGAGPVAVLEIAGPLPNLPFADADGQPSRWPEPGSFARRRLAQQDGMIDEALVLRPGIERAELHLHGGTGTVARVEAWLRGHGLAPVPAVEGELPMGLRAARAAASCRWGPVAELLSALRAGAAPDAVLMRAAREVLSREPFARRLRQPARVRLCGPPNAGKSSLFNALLGSERALVSPQAHTTRDTVRALSSLRGVAVALEDTAGGEGPPPAEGADVVVAVSGRPGHGLAVPGAQAVVQVLGRADLWPGASGLLRVSARTGEGLAALRSALAEALGIPADDRHDERIAWDPAVRDELALADRDLHGG